MGPGLWDGCGFETDMSCFILFRFQEKRGQASFSATMRNAFRRKKGPVKGEKSLSSFFLKSIFKLFAPCRDVWWAAAKSGERSKLQTVCFAFPATSTDEWLWWNRLLKKKMGWYQDLSDFYVGFCLTKQRIQGVGRLYEWFRGRGLFTSRGCWKYEAQRMKLWSSTAIAL